MAEINIAVLKVELLTGPRASDYTALSNQAAADKINNPLAPDALTVDVDTVEGWQLWGATVQAEFKDAALSDADRNSWDAICSQNRINVKDAGVRARVQAIWPASTTRTNLVALQTKLISRGEFLGLPFIGAHHVAEARA